MRKQEMIKILKENGFGFLRNGKHELWSDGLTRITLPHSNKIEQRLSKFIQLQIQKAVAIRHSVQQRQAA